MGSFNKTKENNIKGAIAETIVQAMFQDMGYLVHRSGMEYSTPAFANRKQIFSDNTTDKLIRHFPDFIIEKDGLVHLIEVKYRTYNNYSLEEYQEENGCEYPYPEAFIVLVSPYSIRCEKAENLYDSSQYRLLHDMEEIETNRDIILEYISFCKKYFKIDAEDQVEV